MSIEIRELEKLLENTLDDVAERDMKSVKYKTIYADPPWNESGGGRIKRGADKHYDLMKTKDIVNMKDYINYISGDACHLYLWVTNNFLEDGLLVMKEWGFKYITTITWVKDRIGLGQYYSGITEHCLFGRKGMPPYRKLDGKRQQGTTLIQEPKTEHSKKPIKMYEYIEKVSHPPFIELFARNTREHWESQGYEVDNYKRWESVKS